MQLYLAGLIAGLFISMPFLKMTAPTSPCWPWFPRQLPSVNIATVFSLTC